MEKKTCSEGNSSYFIENTLVHYCRTKEKIVDGPRKTAEECNAYSKKNQDEYMDYINRCGTLGLAERGVLWA